MPPRKFRRCADKYSSLCSLVEILKPLHLLCAQSLIKTIDRYFIITNMVPPIAAALVFGIHIMQTRRATDREYVPPGALWVTLIWGFKILAPLFIYVFIQVKSDHFVKYDNMAQKLCQVSVSLVLYPPGSMSYDRFTLQYDQTQRFSVTNAFTDLRNVTRQYFANNANYMFHSKDNDGDKDFDFESELANLNILGMESRRSVELDSAAADLLRRAAEEWWGSRGNYKQPEAPTCRQDVKNVTTPTVTVGESKPKVKTALSNDADGCVLGSDPDNKVYEQVQAYLKPDPVVIQFCKRGMSAAKKRYGYDAGQAAGWVIGTLATHLDNIITGVGFSYTFCNAETALQDKFLTVGGTINRGMSAFEDRETDHKFYMNCEWVFNDRNFEGEQVLAPTNTKEQCVDLVQKEISKASKSRCTKKINGVSTPATIALFRPGRSEDLAEAQCACQWGSNMEEDESTDAQSCLLRTMLSEAEAKAAAAVNVAKICENFKLKRAKITDLDPGVLRWLDAQVCLPAC